MANLTLLELLQPQLIVDTISKIRVGRQALSTFFGFEIGGGKIKQIPHSSGAFRIFNETRVPSTFTQENTAPVIITPNPAGEQRFYLTRMHEKMVFPADMLGNIAKLDGPNSQPDTGGVDYLERQNSYIAKRFNMGVEVLTAGFIRGQLYLKYSGSQMIPYLSVPSGQYETVSFGQSAQNLDQLAMGTGANIILIPWNNPNAPIFQNLLAIRSAMVAQTGMNLKHVVLNSTTWGYIVQNLSIRIAGGVAESPFAEWTMDTAKDEHGQEMYGAMRAKLKGIPWLDFLIIDDNIAIGGDLDPINTGNNVGTLTKVVPDDYALFCPTPDVSWCRMYHGGEWVAENEGVPNLTWKQGLSAWKRFNSEPSSVSLVSILRALPVPFIVQAMAYGHVSSF